MLLTRGQAATTESSTPPRSQRHLDKSALWAALYGAALAAALFILARTAVTDDSYITLDYARNLAEHGHWGLLADRTANTQTSPLNAWLLAAGIVATGRPIVAVGLLLAVCLAASGWWGAELARELRRSRALPYVLVGLLAASPLLASTVGLETYLGITVLVGVARYAAVGRPVLTGVLCGLAALTRPDLAVPAGVLALGLVRPNPGRLSAKLGLASLVAALVVLPWHIFSWFELGGFVPDTTWIKTSAAETMTMVTAPATFYGLYYPIGTIVTALLVAAGVVCAVVAARHWRQRWARAALAFFVAGWAHWGALAAIDAYPQAWYYGPIAACSAATVAVTVARWRWLGVGSAIAILTIGVASVVASAPIPWDMAPLVANVARSSQYAAAGSQLAALTGGQPVAGPGEVGALAYYSQVPVVDFLSDPTLAAPILEQRYAKSSSIGRAVLGLNWAHRPVEPTPKLNYHLSYASLTPNPSGLVIRWWPIDTPARGPDRLVLTEN